VTCPVCGEERFKSGACVAQHVESGTCPNCPGKENARKAIFGFIRKNSAASNALLDRNLLMLEDEIDLDGGGSGWTGAVPDKPYECRQCSKYFKDVSSLMQHQRAKHGGQNMSFAALMN